MKGFENKQKKRWDAAQARQDLEKKRKMQMILNDLPVRKPKEHSTQTDSTMTSEEFIKRFGTTSFAEGDTVFIIGTTHTTRIFIVG